MGYLVKLLKSRRGISPAIAMILLIGLGIAASSIVTVILNDVDEEGLEAESRLDDNETSLTVNVDFSITKLSRDPSLTLQNITDYSIVTLTVNNEGSSDIYVIDFDIIVYGEKLDDISPWLIKSASGATYTLENGNYVGYRQPALTSAQYTVEVNDTTVARARIPDETTFSYEIKYGDDPGVIGWIEQKERISKIIFEAIFYNVSIFHYGSDWSDEEPSKQYEVTLQEINSSNKLYYIYDRAVDSYDYSDGAAMAALNVTWVTQNYDLVIVDRWAVAFSLDAIITQIHRAGVPIIFYGGLYDIASNIADVQNLFNYTATEDLVGVTPTPYDGTGNVKGTNNTYQFNQTLEAITFGVSGADFKETGWWPGFFDEADELGVDIANFTTLASVFSFYGTTSHRFHDERRESRFDDTNLIWNATGVLGTHKTPVVNETGEVYSFIWKTREDFSRTGAIKTNPGDLSNMRYNMITAILSEADRIIDIEASFTIQSIEIAVKNQQNRDFDVRITAIVEDAAILGTTLNLTINMPDMLDMEDTSFIYRLYVDGDEKSPWLFGYTVPILAGNDILLDFSWMDEGLPAGSVVVITFAGSFDGGFGGWVDMNSAHTAVETWYITGSFQSGALAKLKTFDYSQDIAIDNSVWP